MRFLPKRRASTDQAPGPSIASPAPNMANSIWLQGSPERQKAPHNPIIAAAPPAMGVHKPAHRNSPAAASISSLRKCCWSGDSTDLMTPSWSKVIPAPSRRQRRPIAGQPLAKVENKRCRNSSRFRLRGPSEDRNPRTGFAGSLFRVIYSSMIPRFSPIVTAWVRSFAPSLRRMFLTRLLTVSSEIES
jgi:hypothetical protein